MKTKGLYKALTIITIVGLVLFVLALGFEIFLASSFDKSIAVQNFVNLNTTREYKAGSFTVNYVLYLIVAIALLFSFANMIKADCFYLELTGFVNFACVAILFISGSKYLHQYSVYNKALLYDLGLLDVIPVVLFSLAVCLTFAHYLVICFNNTNGKNVVYPKKFSLVNIFLKPYYGIFNNPLLSPIKKPLKAKEIRKLGKIIFVLNIIFLIFTLPPIFDFFYKLADLLFNYHILPEMNLSLLAIFGVPFLYFTIPSIFSIIATTTRLRKLLFCKKKTTTLLLKENLAQQVVLCIPYLFLAFGEISILFVFNFYIGMEMPQDLISVNTIFSYILIAVLIFSIIIHSKLAKGYNLSCDLNILTDFEDDEFLAPVDEDRNSTNDSKNATYPPKNNSFEQNQPPTPPPHPDVKIQPVEKLPDPFDEFGNSDSDNTKNNE